jgi:flagellar hook protein FlgE
MASIASIALSGMQAAQAQLEASANNVANLNTSGYRRQATVQRADSAGGVATSTSQDPQSGNALSTDVLGLIQSKDAFMANLAVFRSGDQLLGSLVDALS